MFWKKKEDIIVNGMNKGQALEMVKESIRIRNGGSDELRRTIRTNQHSS